VAASISTEVEIIFKEASSKVTKYTNKKRNCASYFGMKNMCFGS